MSELSRMSYGELTVHPRKRMGRTPLVDYAGRPMPTTLDEVYGHYSTAKGRAYTYCKELCRRLDGERFCITGHNCMTFTVSFDFPNPYTGVMMRAIITRSYNHAYFIDPELQ